MTSGDPNCPKCKGTGIIKDEKGVRICFDCLNSGKMDQHTEEATKKETRIKL